MKRPEFLRRFSKKESQEERDALAASLKERRAQARETRTGLEAERDVLEPQQQEAESSLEANRTEQLKLLEELGELAETLAGLQEGAVDKMLNFFKIRSLRGEIKTGTEELDSLEEVLETGAATVDKMRTRLREIIQELQDNSSRDTAWASEQLATFYQRTMDTWERAPYTPEDAEEHFSEERLVQMPLDEYVALLKRFPSEMVTHVSRHGVRDHTGHIGHQAGVGEYHNSFKALLEDGRLKSVISRIVKENFSKESVAEVANMNQAEDRETAELLARQMVDSFNLGGPGSYADLSAIHFAAQEVADIYYGAERGNEAFVVYPSVFIDAQYGYQGNLSEAGGGYWNDQWIFATEQNGISLDAGIVFLPEAAQVGRETGSRYEVVEGKGVINKEYVEQVGSLLGKSMFDEIMNEIRTELGRFNAFQNVPKDLMDRLHERVEKELGVTDERLRDALVTYRAGMELPLSKESLMASRGDLINQNNLVYELQVLDQRIEGLLSDEGIYYKQAPDMISSKDYWEQYFKDNPQERPSKIVYYTQSDPTRALRAWKEQEGLSKTSQDNPFAKRQSDLDAEGAHVMKDRFESVLSETVDYLFPPEVDKEAQYAS